MNRRLLIICLLAPTFLILSIGLFIKTIKAGAATAPVPLRP